MASIRKTIAELPWLLLLILVVLVDGLVGGLYRLGGKSAGAKLVGILLLISFLGTIVSFIALPPIVTKICGIVYVICLVCDIITVAFSKKFVLFAD